MEDNTKTSLVEEGKLYKRAEAILKQFQEPRKGCARVIREAAEDIHDAWVSRFLESDGDIRWMAWTLARNQIKTKITPSRMKTMRGDFRDGENPLL